MITFKTNKDNDNYIVITRFELILMTGIQDIPLEIRNEALDVFSKMIKIEHSIGTIKEIALSKEERLTNFLLSTNLESIRNEDNIVTYNKVINAFNIATFEKNPISDAILFLFRGQVKGKKEELTKLYGKEVIEYILENDDFEKYLKKVNGEYTPNEYLVYENQKFVKKVLEQSINKQKEKI